MFDFNLDNMRQTCRDRQRRIIEHAEAQRLAREAQADQPQLHHHLLAKAGDALIIAGTKLKGRVPATSRQSLVRS